MSIQQINPKGKRGRIQIRAQGRGRADVRNNPYLEKTAQVLEA